MKGVEQFPVAAVTKFHTLGGLKQQKLHSLSSGGCVLWILRFLEGAWEGFSLASPAPLLAPGIPCLVIVSVQSLLPSSHVSSHFF